MTFPDLCLRIARAVKDEPELDRVPLPVIASAIEAGMRHFALHCPMSFGGFAEIEAFELETCERCSHFIDPEVDDGHAVDAEGVYLCNACAVEGDLAERQREASTTAHEQGKENGDA